MHACFLLLKILLLYQYYLTEKSITITESYYIDHADSVDILYSIASTCICNFMSFTSQSKFSFVIHVIQ